jgi:hypothetical protein
MPFVQSVHLSANRPTSGRAPIEVTSATIENVAAQLSGAAGPGGVYAVNIQNWLLRYGGESSTLWGELAEWATWLANDHPPWAA